MGVARVVVPLLALCLCGGAAGGRPQPSGTLVVESRLINDWSGHALFVLKPTGGRPRTLIGRASVGQPGADYDLPAWSPDMTRVAYGRCVHETQCRIGIVNLRTRKPKPLSRGTGPSWAPDGRTLAFAASRPEEIDEALSWSWLATVPVEGGRARRLARGLIVDAPAWSPDGRHIAFVGIPASGDPATARAWLYTIRPNGRSLRRLVEVAAGGQLSGDIGHFRPSWSPDSKCLAVGGAQSLIVVNLDGRMRWRLDNRQLVLSPSWSPEGRRIAFNDHPNIYVVNRDGTGVRALTRGKIETSLHGWERGGRSLAITRELGGLFLVDAQGRGERKLLDGDFGDVVWGWPRRR